MAQRKTFEIEWDAHEYEHKERGQDWFWAVGIVTISLAIVAVILGNIIFAILIIISALALTLFINRHPETVHITIDELGVTKGSVRYPYDTLDSFWIDIDHPHKKIILRSKKLLMPLIIIPLGEEIDPEQLKNTLDEYLPEKYHRLPFAEGILEYLGF